jgi:hypothetical protein
MKQNLAILFLAITNCLCLFAQNLPVLPAQAIKKNETDWLMQDNTWLVME